MFKGTIGYRSALGGCLFEGFAASFIGAWEHLRLSAPQERYYFLRGLSCMLHDSANQMAERFKGDWVLLCDTDHVFDSSVFTEMVETFEGDGLDILTGFTQARQPPYRPVMFKSSFNPLESSKVIPAPREKAKQRDLIPIDAGGAACLMVRRRVFEAMARELNEKPFSFRPRFRPTIEPTGPQDFGTAYIGDKPKDFDGDMVWWEDYSFFIRAKLLGFQVYCAPWIKFYHVEKRLVTDELADYQERSSAIFTQNPLQNAL